MRKYTGYRRAVGQWQPSAAERRVLDELVANRTNAEIAVRLGLSPETVKSHVARMLGETGSADRAALSRWWQERRDRPPLLIPVLGWGLRLAAVIVAASLAVLFVVAKGPGVAQFVTALSPQRTVIPQDPPPTPTASPSAAAAPYIVPTVVPLGPLTAYAPPANPAAQVAQEIDVGTEPYYLAVGEGAVWVPNRRDGTLTRVDARTGAVVATIPIGDPARGGTFGTAPTPGVGASVAVMGGFVWVAKEDTRAVAQVDPRTNTVVGTIDLGVLPHKLAAGRDALWVTSREGGPEDGVLRVDLAARRVVATIKTPVPGSIAVTDDAVWVTNVRADTVTRIDPRTNQIAAVVPLPGPGPHFICSLCTNVVVVAGGAVWVGYTRGGVGSELARIDPATNSIVATIAVAANPIHAVADERGIWIAHFASETVTRIGPATNTVVGASQVGYPIIGLALDGDTAWATSHPRNRVLRLTLLP